MNTDPIADMLTRIRNALVARHDRLRAVQRESLRQAEHLFQSLLHHEFTQTS